MISEINRLSGRKNLLFVNKKKQKNFLGFLRKSFLLLFFKKDAS